MPKTFKLCQSGEILSNLDTLARILPQAVQDKPDLETGPGQRWTRLVCKKEENSVTRLGDFLNFLATNFPNKSSPNIWTLFGLL